MLGEAASLCLERLLALARSLAASMRFARPADDGIRWPNEARLAVAMLRAQVCALRTLFRGLQGICRRWESPS